MDNPVHLGPMKALPIVDHSVAGGTRQMVEAAAHSCEMAEPPAV
jgi:hypothetical protein